MRFFALVPLSALTALTILTGCALTNTATPGSSTGPLLKGNVHGGRQPVVGAHVYLFAAGTSGYGGASTSLITVGSAAGSDTLGNYVTTDSLGSFSVTGDYTCTTGTQVYLLATGGNPGLPDPQTNPNLALMAALSQCPASGTLATALPVVSINEVTTVASVYALSGFMTDLTHVSSSGTTLSNTGMANAFANVNNLVNIVTGAALATTPAGNGTVPQAEINTLANILATCINSTGATSTPCSTLFSTALNGSTQPTDTVTAALNIAQHPGTGITALYALGNTTPPFGPALTAQPNDFTIALNFTGGGVTQALYSDHLAVDGSGNIWVTNGRTSTVSKFSSLGAAMSPSGGYTGGGLNSPTGIAIDPSGNVWVANISGSTGITKLNGTTGAALSPSTGYSGGGSTGYSSGIAVDGSGNVWITNFSTLSKFDGTGTAISSASGYTGGGLSSSSAIAIDGFGNVWVTDVAGASSKLSKFNGITGAAISTASGYTGGGLNGPECLAVDNNGEAWASNLGASALSHFTSAGSALSGAGGYTGGGLAASVGIAIDGAGTIWVADGADDDSIQRVSRFSNTGAAITPSTGYYSGGSGAPQNIVIDGSGNVWTESGSTLSELVGAATPVVTPLSAGVANNSLGKRP